MEEGWMGSESELGRDTKLGVKARCWTELLLELDSKLEIESGGLDSNSDTWVGIEFL